METKRFDLGTVLSVTTGFLLTPIGNLYDIMSHLIGHDVYTHELALHADTAKTGLLKQLPQFVGLDTSGISPATATSWLAAQVEKFGNEFDVAPLSPEGQGERTESPMSTLQRMVTPRAVSNTKTKRTRRPVTQKSPVLTRKTLPVNYRGRVLA